MDGGGSGVTKIVEIVWKKDREKWGVCVWGMGGGGGDYSFVLPSISTESVNNVRLLSTTETNTVMLWFIDV